MENDSRTIQITIDADSGIPIWLQLRNRLVYLISSGAFACDDKLPTVRELAVDLGINYNTVSKVYQDIERDGYIVSYRGRGTFVSDKYLKNEGAAESEADSLIDDFIRQCRELGIPRQDIPELVARRLQEADQR
ncbi:GntR family transcriptional regulator [Raoultibacter phocaeensis]|uniref:GntR family transcriptional regulator n=1 Tax=Raoultibacter phocaeensis TaxID=2479841 RepID=UPI0021083A72|nr:GntR family transcriptional regulator [Raoultibacter phocaeensis]